jgi:hypothetical protein
MSKLVDLAGEKFGNLTVIHRAESRNGDTYWVCRCSCGKETEVRADHLKSRKICSCGCLTGELIAKKKITHGMRETRLYGIWNSMIQRCENEKSTEAYLYRDRGITVCPEWHRFEVFRDWALANGYADSLTIDRKNNNGNYEPNNCRWATLIEQANNKRTNRRVEYKNEIKTLAQWAREYEIDYRKLWLRLKRGWDFERALVEGTAV